MAHHQVKFTIPYRLLGKRDIEFRIYNHYRRRADSLLGTLFVSHGAIEWRPAHKKHKVKLGWPDFDRRMRGG